MEESVLKPVDRMGRIVIPAEWRKNWGKRVILVRLSDDEVILRALRKRGKLTDLADAIEVHDVEDFSDTHKLRKAVYG
ncbi:MAG: hypothetical protein AOA65_1642 [Candidatus Bathyarchaeota archaeon BA1]|nr:MAG: hypothetical protein AOA65_1642 [Candidatus Bathyarchaeota archaeon BA1]